MRMGSDDPDVLRFFTLAARRDIELDALTLIQGLVTVSLDVGEVDEDILALLPTDEAETLLGIEKLDCSCNHCEFSLCFGRAKTTDPLPGAYTRGVSCQHPCVSSDAWDSHCRAR